jgi:hypothetical protein
LVFSPPAKTYSLLFLQELSYLVLVFSSLSDLCVQ